MEIITGAAIICVAASVAIWANDNLPHNDKDDLLLDIPPTDAPVHATHAS
jgi:hypothetical protein